ncbi:MAG: amidase, partial [Anaerolineae bacterium]|nr:amidase [Anaerolineae bacterium]
HASMYDQYTKLYRPRTAEIIEIGRTVTDDERAEAKASMARLRAELTDLMDVEGIDLWACPAALGPAPEGIHATGDPAMNLPWTHAGMPAITLPAGLADNGLPLGLQLVARFGQDEMLLGWAELISKTGVLTGRR